MNYCAGQLSMHATRPRRKQFRNSGPHQTPRSTLDRAVAFVQYLRLSRKSLGDTPLAALLTRARDDETAREGDQAPPTGPYGTLTAANDCKLRH